MGRGGEAAGVVITDATAAATARSAVGVSGRLAHDVGDIATEEIADGRHGCADDGEVKFGCGPVSDTDVVV